MQRRKTPLRARRFGRKSPRPAVAVPERAVVHTCRVAPGERVIERFARSAYPSLVKTRVQDGRRESVTPVHPVAKHLLVSYSELSILKELIKTISLVR